MSSPRLSRRQALRTLGAGAALLAASPLSYCAPGAARRDKPNVIFILADDLGYGDLGSYGAVDVRTPNLDELARSGTRLTQFYVTAPVCTPSRVSFLTGRHYNFGIEPGVGMAASEVTMAEMFRTAGYRTALFGKWHLGIPLHVSPNAQGFDEFLGFKVGAMDNYSHFYYWGGVHRHVLFKDEEPYREDGVFFPDIVTRESKRFIAENKDRPFFLYLPFNQPHYPLQSPAGTVDRFGGIQDELRREYAACVWTLDDHVGQILASLDEHGLRENTIVVFASDHGPSDEERGGGGSAGILRGGKGTLWDGGIRVPAIFSWPGVIPKGEVRNQAVMSTDLLPTLAAYTGVPAPGRRIDGRSLVQVIASGAVEAPRPVLHWTYADDWALREGPWKFTAEKTTGFLANLDDDPGEVVNRMMERQDLVERFVASHNAWIQDLAQGRAAGL